MHLSRFFRTGLAALAGIALAVSGPAARAQSTGARDLPTFGTATELVYVRFHVEKKGGYADALRPDQIRVLEDGRPQAIALLETPSTRERTVPPEVTLALDVSSSVMDDALLDESLLKEVLLATLGEQARIGLCAFGGELRCLTEPTRDSRRLDGGVPAGDRVRPRAAPRRARGSTPPWPTWPSRPRRGRRRSAR